MPDPIDAVEVELLAAARRRARGRARRGAPRLRPLAVAVAGLAVAVPAVASVTHTWPGADADDGGAPRVQFAISDRAADAATRQAFSVLTHPRVAADALPAAAVLPPLAAGVHVTEARRLLTTPAGGLWLVPVDAVLPRPLATLAPSERTGPPGVCVAATDDAPGAFSCAPTAELVGDAAGVSAQTAACVPGSPDVTHVLGLAVDDVADLTVDLADGASRPVRADGNVFDLALPLDARPARLRWTYRGVARSRPLQAPPASGRCEPSSRR